MKLLMLTLTLVFLSMLFIFNSHPLILSFILMMFSFGYGVTLALTSSTSWLAYMLIMVFLSGMMIIILYMTGLSSNENIKVDTKKLIFSSLASVSLVALIFIFDKKMTNKMLSNELHSFFNKSSMELVYKTYNPLLTQMTVLLIIYLFITLIVAVKIVSFNKGPMKMMIK